MIRSPISFVTSYRFECTLRNNNWLGTQGLLSLYVSSVSLSSNKSYVTTTVTSQNLLLAFCALRLFPFFYPCCCRLVRFSRKIRSPSETKALGSSQGTPPSSPATMSTFSRAVGAATTMANKQASNQTQIQSTGNPLGIAAVLLQGAQGKFRI